jgi:dihydrofolate reductase
MAKLIYATNTSLDGYIEDSDGSFDWSMPTAKLHQFYNDEFRDVGTHIYGRKLYESMAVWETMDLHEEGPPETAHLKEVGLDFQEIWRGAQKVVYSTTVEEVWTPRTELKSSFDSEEVRAMKDTADADLIIGGANLAASAFAAGLVDEISITILPVSVGAGKPALPVDQKIELELLSERFVDNSTVNLQYKVKQLG